MIFLVALLSNTKNRFMNPKAFYKLSYGLYIISSKKDDKLNGYVANTAFQVTADPPQMAISCHKDNLSSEYIKHSGVFSVSVLNQNATKGLLGKFGFNSGKQINKFEGTDFKTGASGAPIVLSDTIAWFDCKVVQTVDVGSHILFVGEIVDVGLLDESQEPLTYAWYQQEKNGKAPKNAPTYQKPDSAEAKVHVSGGKFKKYQCIVCGHIYDEEEGDPDSGIVPGTKFDDLPDDWVCPTCGAEKEDFEEI